MRIWIDITNSPHINFFKPFIDVWEKEGNQIILTCRDLSNTIDLIKQNEWNYIEVGGHAGGNYIKKIIHFVRRVVLLIRILKEENPEVGISHSSLYSPLVSRLLKIPSIYINDNEHAKGNYLAFSFSTINYLPEVLKLKSKELKWDKMFNIKYYPGIKEGIYLSNAKSPEFYRKSRSKKTIYIRPEPWTAQYYKADKFFFDELIKELKIDYRIVLLPRGTQQANYYNKKEFSGIKIAEKALELSAIIQNCDLFIGAGGSMTREIAYLKIPTISIYQDHLLEVDKYLIKNGFMMHKKNLVRSDIESFLSTTLPPAQKILVEKGRVAFKMINNSVLKYGRH